MDDRSFDALVRSLASGSNRRQILRGLLGLGAGVAAAGTVAQVDAARRPTVTPTVPKCPGSQYWNGSACVCSSGTNCGSDCCTGDAVCCDNACCFGECYGEELCCPTGSIVCDGECVTGECCSTADCESGAYCDENRICQICPACDTQVPLRICGSWGDGGSCWASCDADGALVCWEGHPCAGLQECETNADCSGGEHCIVGGCCSTPVCVPLCNAGNG